MTIARDLKYQYSNLRGNIAKNAGDPVDDQDLVTKSYIDGRGYVTVGFDAGANYVCDGTADDVQIQAATDYLTNGGIITVRKGTYNLSNKITLSNPDILLQGEGNSTKLRLADNINTPVLEITDTNVSIDRIKIDGNKTNNNGNGYGVYLSSSIGAYISNCNITNCYSTGIYAIEATFSKISHNEISDIGTDIDSGGAMYFTSNSNDNIIQENLVHDMADGIIFYDSTLGRYNRRNKVINNTVYNITDTVLSRGTSGGIVGNSSPSIEIYGNTVHDVYHEGIHVFGDCPNATIHDNKVYLCGVLSGGMGIDTGDNPSDIGLSLCNNDVSRCGGSGFGLSGNIKAVVIGNKSINNGRYLAGDGSNRAGIKLNEGSGSGYSPIDDNVVSNNICTDTGRTQVVATTDGSPIITSDGNGDNNWTDYDLGKTITGVGIPAATTIISIQAKNQVTLSANATVTGTPTVTLVKTQVYGIIEASYNYAYFNRNVYSGNILYGNLLNGLVSHGYSNIISGNVSDTGLITFEKQMNSGYLHAVSSAKFDIAGIWAFAADAAQTDYDKDMVSASGHLGNLNSHSDNDEVSFGTINLNPGTYLVTLCSSKDTSRGILEILIDTTSIGTFDQYGVSTKNVLSTFTFSPTTAISGTLRVKVSGKNGSSSNYYLLFSRLEFIKTA